MTDRRELSFGGWRHSCASHIHNLTQQARQSIDRTKFTFGATSAIITNLGLIVGLDEGTDAKFHIVGALLLIALADNISDSLGIHMHQESEGLSNREAWFSTLTNFIARLFVSAIFILLVWYLPLNLAVLFSIIWGILLLVLLSVVIARSQQTSVSQAIVEHLGLAVVVIALSRLVGHWISEEFNV